MQLWLVDINPILVKAWKSTFSEFSNVNVIPVGASILVQTNHPKIPYMIAAPTMITPGAVPASHCFYAMIAILNAASRNHKVVKQVFCPGLATHTGRVAPEMAAEEMAKAYRKWQERIG
jgi:O-acetyl-ADP-ribose deacetylase (regulator of RNase III)